MKNFLKITKPYLLSFLSLENIFFFNTLNLKKWCFEQRKALFLRNEDCIL